MDGLQKMNHQYSFERYLLPSSTPYGLPFPKIWGSQPHSKLQSKIKGKRVLIEDVWRAYRNSPTLYRMVPSTIPDPSNIHTHLIKIVRNIDHWGRINDLTLHFYDVPHHQLPMLKSQLIGHNQLQHQHRQYMRRPYRLPACKHQYSETPIYLGCIFNQLHSARQWDRYCVPRNVFFVG